jgi:hypothetical protein
LRFLVSARLGREACRRADPPRGDLHCHSSRSCSSSFLNPTFSDLALRGSKQEAVVGLEARAADLAVEDIDLMA